MQPTCVGESNGSISVEVNKGTGSFTYAWSTGATVNTITDLSAGSYSVTINGFDDGSITRTYALENPAPITVNLGSDVVLCKDQTIDIDATVEDLTATYLWTSDNGFTSEGPTVTLSKRGNYMVTVTSQTGCTSQGTIFVDVSDKEISAEFAMSSQVFTNETLIVVDLSYPIPEGVQWILPEGAELVKQNNDEVQVKFNTAGNYEIGLITTSGDCTAIATKNVIVLAQDGLIPLDGKQNGQKNIEDFILYPNPTSGVFTANVAMNEAGAISIKVYSLTNNNLIASHRAKGSDTYKVPFDISGMPTGVYAVLLETPYGNTLRKLIIK